MNNISFAQDMFDNGPLMFLLIDLNKTIIQCNNSLKKRFDEKIIGTNVYLLFKSCSYQVLDDLNPEAINCNLVLKNNKKVKVNIVPIIEKGIIKYFKFYMYDISEWNEKLESIFDVGEIGMWQWEIGTDIVEFSDGADKIFESSNKITSYKQFLSFIKDADIERVDKLIREGIEKKKFRIIFKLKNDKYISIKCKVYRNTLIGICWDITEKMLSTKKMQTNMKRLEQTNEELEQFAYIASHDLREPLTGIAGFASLFKSRYAKQDDDGNHIVDKKGMSYIDIILESCKKMSIKMDDLLSWSRAARGESDVFGEEFNLNDALEEAKFSLNGKISNSQCQISVMGKMPQIKGSKSMIAQVLQNIIGNALKYRKESEEPKIELKVKDIGKNYLISIKDNGIGFDEKHCNKIFTAFQRLHGVEEYSGTGIGLAIVKKIIDKHEGEIWATSEIGVGSVFNFTLKKA